MNPIGFLIGLLFKYRPRLRDRSRIDFRLVDFLWRPSNFITGLPLCRGFDALLTLTDKFSKAIRLILCKSITSAEETAQL